MSISVNISPKDFYYIDIFNTFAGLVKKYDIEPSNLKIEITETTIMSDAPNLMGELEELRKAGFTIEMDDFGSGYSSLNTLKDINIDVLKVDMGFIKETKLKRDIYIGKKLGEYNYKTYIILELHR